MSKISNGGERMVVHPFSGIQGGGSTQFLVISRGVKASNTGTALDFHQGNKPPELYFRKKNNLNFMDKSVMQNNYRMKPN